MDVDVIIITKTDHDLRVPAPDDFDKLCRVCLVPFTADKYRNIHDEEAQMNIRSLIEVYTFIKIPENKDSLPQNICIKCIDFLVSIHMFRSRCHLNNDLLLKIQQRNAALKSNNDGSTLNTVDDSFDAPPKDETHQLIDMINDERMGIYRCKDCQLEFGNAHDLKIHRFKTKHPRQRSRKCPHCSKMFNSSAIKSHMQTHTKEKPYLCSTCGATFAKNNNLQRHRKIHEEEHAFTCVQCNKSFSRAESLAYHMRVGAHRTKYANNVEGDKGLECLVCKKRYSNVKQLRIHMQHHRKRFLCNNCGKAFSTKDNLNKHLRVHTGERPYICTVCNRGFTQSSSLKTHMGAIHPGQTPHQCAICKKNFCMPSMLRKHFLKHVKDDVNDIEYYQALEGQEDTTEVAYSPAEDIKIETGEYKQQKSVEDAPDDEDNVYMEEYVEDEEFTGLDVAQEIQVTYNVGDGLQEIVYEEADVVDENGEYEGEPAHVELCIAEDSETNNYKMEVFKQA